MFVLFQGKTMSGGWKDSYMHGVSCELYSSKLSNFFIDMPFPDVVEQVFAIFTHPDYHFELKAQFQFEKPILVLLKNISWTKYVDFKVCSRNDKQIATYRRKMYVSTFRLETYSCCESYEPCYPYDIKGVKAM